MKKEIKKVLETHYWISGLKTDHGYFVSNDDCEGRLNEGIQVTIDG